MSCHLSTIFSLSFLLGCFEWRKSYWGMLDTIG